MHIYTLSISYYEDREGDLVIRKLNEWWLTLDLADTICEVSLAAVLQLYIDGIKPIYLFLFFILMRRSDINVLGVCVRFSFILLSKVTGICG